MKSSPESIVDHDSSHDCKPCPSFGFLPPHFTQILNIFTDEMLPYLGFAEIKVLLVLFRHSFGWNRNRFKISLSQFEMGTGLTRTNILRAINSLIKRGLISKETVGPKSNRSTYYELIIQGK
jgi:DNA-binding MarR family transcriptional regulator